MGYRGRDVEVKLLRGDQYLVVACDSSGAIGSKELDVVQVPPQITGRFTARVALFEVLASGAEPEILTVAISSEASPTGEGIIEGVYQELNSLGLGHVPIAISTEKNMLTRQTGLGISIVGICGMNDLRLGSTQIGDTLYGLGLPKVGQEVQLSEDPEIISAAQIRKLLKQEGIHDVIPVGSQGIRGEAELLARSVQGEYLMDTGCTVDFEKSAGPATALIFSAEHEIQGLDFEMDLGLKPYRVGQIITNKR